MPNVVEDPVTATGEGVDADVGPVALDPRPPFVLPPLPSDRRARRYRVDPLTVDLREGTLPDLGHPVDAIVSPDDNYLSHAGGVSAALWRAAGRDFAATQAQQSRQLVLGEVHVTTAGFLPARFIFHAVTIDLNLNRTIIPAHLPIVYRKVVRTAREHDCVNVALPLLAAGAAQISPTLSAAAFAHVVRTAPSQGPLRHLLLYVLPELFDTVAPVFDSALARRRREPRWWITGAVTYLPREDARELLRMWRRLPADPDWRVSVAALLEAAVERAHQRIADGPDSASERVRGSIAEVRMARNQIEHAKGRLTDEELGIAGKAIRDLGDALSLLPAPAAPSSAHARELSELRVDDRTTTDLTDRAGSRILACAASAPLPELAAPACDVTLSHTAHASAPPMADAGAGTVAEPLRTLAAPPDVRPEPEGGTAHVRALHQFLLARLSPPHLDALADLLEKQGYRGDRDFRLLEHLVRQDPGRLLRQFFSVFDLRAILEKEYGLRSDANLSHRQTAALVLRQLGFQPPRRPRGLLAAQAAARDAVARVRVLQTPGTRLRGDVVEVGSQLEYVCHVLLRFVSQVVFECPPEVLFREKLGEDGALDKAGLGQLFGLVESLDARARRDAAARVGILGFPPRPLLPEHGKGDLPKTRNYFAHSRIARLSSNSEEDLARGRKFLEGAQALLDYVADPEHRVFPLMIVVRAIHYDRWGRRKVLAQTESGEREIIFTEKPLRPGDAYMMRPLSNPVRVDPLLVPAGDFGLRE